MTRTWKSRLLGSAFAAVLCAVTSSAAATDVEPRLLSNGPVGIQFLGLNYASSHGDVAFDSSIPVAGVSGDAEALVLSYARLIDVFGRSGQIAVAVPYVDLELEGLYLGQPAAADRLGMGDPHLRFAVNLFGAPALSRSEFGAWEQKTIVGVNLDVSAPLGEYGRNRVVNIGTNRWTVSSQLGVSRRIGPVTLEAAVGGYWFGDNDQALGKVRLEQDPLIFSRGGIVVHLPRSWWLSGGYYYAWGGETSLDGRKRDDRQDNTRMGLTLSVPIVPRHRVQVRWSDGISSRIGTDFRTLGVAWQYQF